MREIVIISGKGGTGKTSIAGALAFVAKDRVIMADCDVDAADLHLILQPKIVHREDFFSGVKAEINSLLCNGCNLCHEVCRFKAVKVIDSDYSIDKLKCEGCGYCSYVCPEKAIELKEQKVGECFTSETRAGSMLVHARLGIGADNSGKLVAKVKKEARLLTEREGNQYILIDGSPGIGCPVISSLSGADFALIVTEPTRSGLHDMLRVWELSQKFNIPTGCIVNKADLNRDITCKIEQFLEREGIKYIEALSYDDDFQRAITNGLSITELNPSKWEPIFQAIWNKLTQ